MSHLELNGEPWIMNLPEEVAVDFKADTNTVCISVIEPCRLTGREWAPPPMLGQYADVLRLAFEDFDAQRMHPENAVLCSPVDAQQIVEFTRRHRGKNLVVHCAAGISRSGAIVETILRAHPEYHDRGWGRHPNGHVRRLLEQAFGIEAVVVQPTGPITHSELWGEPR